MGNKPQEIIAAIVSSIDFKTEARRVLKLNLSTHINNFLGIRDYYLSENSRLGSILEEVFSEPEISALFKTNIRKHFLKIFNSPKAKKYTQRFIQDYLKQEMTEIIRNEVVDALKPFIKELCEELKGDKIFSAIADSMQNAKPKTSIDYFNKQITLTLPFALNIKTGQLLETIQRDKE